MKTALIVIVLVVVAGILLLFVLGFVSRSGQPPGLVDGRLAQCPAKPNCVSTEAGDAAHYIEPLPLRDTAPGDVLPVIRAVIEQMGGRVRVERDHYLASTFSSAIFGFVDDLEVLVDPEAGLVHLRSASRVGHGDMGVNRKRASLLRQRLWERLREPDAP